MELAKHVKKLRKNKRWSQQELATKTKLSFNAITKIEQGCVFNCKITTLEKIADAFEISIDQLVGRL